MTIRTLVKVGISLRVVLSTSMEKIVAKDMSSVLTLNDGVKMPLFGLGTWRASNGGETASAVLHALKNGYRLIDTAAFYGNEEDVGKAVKKSGLRREEVFVVTKLWVTDHGYKNCMEAFRKSLKRLNMDFVDLYLIHAPSGGKILETYDAMLELKKEGLIRSVGVSNFNVHHLEGLQEAGRPTPSVNQIQLHPYQRCEELVQYCREHQIGVMGYCPLVRCQKQNDPALLAITERCPGKTVNQVLLRWGIQNGYITIPKSSKPARIDENANIFDFEITPEDMTLMGTFPDHHAGGWRPLSEPWTG